MSLPTRTLASQPDPAQLKRQAKEILKDFAAGDPATVAEVTRQPADGDAIDEGLERRPASEAVGVGQHELSSLMLVVLGDIQVDDLRPPRHRGPGRKR